MKTLLYIGGFYHLAFAVFHIAFWKLLNWKKDLRRLTEINQSVMQILNLRLIYVFFVIGCLSLFFTGDLLADGIGKVILFAVALFWLMRAGEQLIFFNSNDKISILLFMIFMSGAGIYGYLCFFR